MKHWKIEIDSDGIALITFDMADRRINTLDAETLEEFAALVARIKADAAIRGVVLASAKAGTFCAGGDFTHLETFAGPPEAGTEAETLTRDVARLTEAQALFRTLETCGKPVACAIEGTALGGGAELVTACHYRVASDGPEAKIGLIEASLGLLPAGGGTQRLPRIVGIRAALPLLLESKIIGAAEALKIGLVHALVPLGETVAAARNWVREHGDPVQPWDKKGYAVPGGGPYVQANSEAIAVAAALSRQRYHGNYPAQGHILTAVYEGTQLPFDAGLRIEMREFIKAARSPQARSILRTKVVSPREIRNGANRPLGIPVRRFHKAVVIGAGLMGSGIAHAQAAAGIETVLIDVTQEAADKGKAHVRAALEKAIARGRSSPDAADAILARITATTDYDRVADADIVIEAVFEDRAVKAEVARRAEAKLAPGAVLASNTSTLPITGLAAASARPESFIGLHFFSPVERMELVEIIRGERTNDATLAAAFDYVAAIRKTPIVVKDSRGFYTSRTISMYLEEPCEMLAEGIAPAIVENIGQMTGMPVGPLSLPDAIGLELPYHVLQQTRRDLGDAYVPSAADAILHKLVVEHGRHGRRNGKGFFDYAEDGKTKSLWPGLADIAKPTLTDAFDERVKTDLKNRILYRMALEAAKCLEEGVLADPREADVGATLGFSFPLWTGGPLSLIDQVGVAAFVAQCDRLADLYGERFRPGRKLREMAASGERFY